MKAVPKSYRKYVEHTSSFLGQKQCIKIERNDFRKVNYIWEASLPLYSNHQRDIFRNIGLAANKMNLRLVAY